MDKAVLTVFSPVQLDSLNTTPNSENCCPNTFRQSADFPGKVTTYTWRIQIVRNNDAAPLAEYQAPLIGKILKKL